MGQNFDRLITQFEKFSKISSFFGALDSEQALERSMGMTHIRDAVIHLQIVV